jgi:cytochrome c peroxidase
MIRGALLLVATMAALSGVASHATARAESTELRRARIDAADDWRWDLPPNVTPPPVPADNPMSKAKFELGRRLFYDKRLSGNGVLSCAGCHLQSRAFADNLPRAIGSTGEMHPRSVMMLQNVGYAANLTWADAAETRLEHQLLTPLFNARPLEMGLTGGESALLARLRSDTVYRRMFGASFPLSRTAFSLGTVTQALATFERGLVSFRSPYDRERLLYDTTALSPAAKRGRAVFSSERTQCANCHRGVNLSSGPDAADQRTRGTEYFSNGLYAVGAQKRYPAGNRGRAEFTHQLADDGLFKAPSLRNVALTAPYMHDGSLATLDAVIAHYERGGRLIATGPNAGDGRQHANKSPRVQGFRLSPTERQDLLAFLAALTDSAFIRDPKFSDPFAPPVKRP